MSLADGEAWEKELVALEAQKAKEIADKMIQQRIDAKYESASSMLDGKVAKGISIVEKEYRGMPHKDEEDGGGSCGYYEVFVDEPNLYHEYKRSYLAECGEITEALQMDPRSANIFKELWRTAAENIGKKKKGNDPVRSAEKVLFFAKRNLKRALFDAEKAQELAKERLENI